MTSITRSVTVPLDPAAAFDVFTSQIGAWFPRGRHSFNYPERAVGIEIEPGIGGRWREIWRDGGGYEIGRVLAWEPGQRLLVSYRNRYLPDHPRTEIEVRFEPAPGRNHGHAGAPRLGAAAPGDVPGVVRPGVAGAGLGVRHLRTHRLRTHRREHDD